MTREETELLKTTAFNLKRIALRLEEWARGREGLEREVAVFHQAAESMYQVERALLTQLLEQEGRAMTSSEMDRYVGCCSYPGYMFRVSEDGRGAIYLQGTYEEPDVLTGVKSMQYTRRWLLSPAATKSEIVQTVFKCLLTSMEHRAREFFHYQGRAVFGPHFDVDRLWELADGEHLEER